jgi:hypothetical protein
LESESEEREREERKTRKREKAAPPHKKSTPVEALSLLRFIFFTRKKRAHQKDDAIKKRRSKSRFVYTTVTRTTRTQESRARSRGDLENREKRKFFDWGFYLSLSRQKKS